MNTLNPRKLVGSVVYCSHLFSGSVFQSPHTLAQNQKDWVKYMDEGPGKGRNGVQRAFHKIDAKLGKAKPNYLP